MQTLPDMVVNTKLQDYPIPVTKQNGYRTELVLILPIPVELRWTHLRGNRFE